jgi:hypothetical protein
MVEVPVATVQRGGYVTPLKRRPRDDEEDEESPSPEVVKRRDRIAELHAERPRSTKEDFFVSKRTVQRDKRALGGRHLTCERVQRLSDLQKTKRLAFAKKLLSEDKNWEKFVFSDETKRGTSDMDSTAWVYPGEQRQVKEEQRWDCKIHVWGYIGTAGVRCIRRIDKEGVVTQATYVTLLKTTLGKRGWKSERIFQRSS